MLNDQRVTVNVSKQYGHGKCLKFLWNSVDSKKDTPSRKRDQGMASVMASLKDMALLKVILGSFSNGTSTSFYFCCALWDQQIQELLSTLRISSCAENRFFSAVSWVTLGSQWLATSPHPFQCMLLGSPTHGVLRFLMLHNLGVLLFPKIMLFFCYIYIYTSPRGPTDLLKSHVLTMIRWYSMSHPPGQRSWRSPPAKKHVHAFSHDVFQG